MKTLLLLLLLAGFSAAQSQPSPCGSPSAAAAAPIPSGRPSSVAAKAAAASPLQDAAVEPAGQSANPRPAAGAVAAQIQPRRPAPTQLSVSCRCGTVAAMSLTAPSASQEVPILTALAGNFRFDHVLVQETTRFASDSAGSLVVGVARASFPPDVLSPFALESPSAPYNFSYERPSPPQITGAYDLVLNFKASGPLGDGNVSNFSSGAVSWEVCGYNAPPTLVR
ncbi:MAG: hypothetical protein ABSC05_30660 [Candidatus Solibacter sp.]|jgi:hypothetical protein